MITDALVLAAGKGTRMKTLTKTVPKAIVKLHEQTLIEHCLDGLQGAGIARVVVVVGHGAQRVHDYLGHAYKGMAIEYANQKKQDGTARAIGLGKKFFKRPFLVGYCDVLAPAGLWKKLATATGCPHIMCVRPDPHPERYGVVTLSKGLAAEIVEKPSAPKSKWVNAACYRFAPTVFKAIAQTKKNPKRGEYEITDTIARLIGQKKLGIVKWNGPLFDIGTPEDLYEAEVRMDS